MLRAVAPKDRAARGASQSGLWARREPVRLMPTTDGRGACRCFGREPRIAQRRDGSAELFPSVVRYLAGAVILEITAADIGPVCPHALAGPAGLKGNTSSNPESSKTRRTVLWGGVNMKSVA